MANDHQASRSVSTDFRQLCWAVEELGGTIRLARRGGNWGVTVTVPDPEDDSATRAGGFFFNEIAELGTHARLLIDWISQYRRPSSQQNRGTR